MPPFPSPTKTWHSTSYPKISPTRPELSAKGKFVVVTGGGTGIGAETARSFTQAGATRIALLGRRLQPLLDTKASIESQYPGVEVLTASADVTDAAQVEEAFTSFTNNSTVKIDVLISNAGTMGPPGAILASDPADFMAGVNSNIAGALHVARAFLRCAAPDAVVVNVSSSASHDTFGDIFGSYSVGKWGAIRLWDFVGKNNPGMRVYHIQPGVVDTDMNRAAGGVEAMGYEDHGKLPPSPLLSNMRTSHMKTAS